MDLGDIQIEFNQYTDDSPEGYSIRHRWASYYLGKGLDGEFYMRSSYGTMKPMPLGRDMSPAEALRYFRMDAMARGVYYKETVNGEIGQIRQKPLEPVTLSSTADILGYIDRMYGMYGQITAFNWDETTPISVPAFAGDSTSNRGTLAPTPLNLSQLVNILNE